MQAIKGQVWVITGASMGIGASVAQLVAARGGIPVLAARSADKLDEIASGIEGDSLVVPTDVTDPDACERLVEKTLAAYGRINALVVNAGRTMHAYFHEADPSVHRKVMELNYFGAVETIRAALAALEKSKGVIVAVSSVAGLRGFPTRTGYSASKFALNGFCEALRVELAPRGVAVTVVCPGVIITGMRERALGADGKPRGKKESFTAPGRPMTADECARHIINAGLRRNRTVVLTGAGKLGGWLNRWMPGVFDRLLIRAQKSRFAP